MAVAASAQDSRVSRFRASASSGLDPERPPAGLTAAGAASEAPTGFDNLTNGFMPQGPDFDTLEEDNVEPGRSFNDDRFIFEEAEDVDDGLGPTHNAQACRECHQSVVTGGASQIAEQRSGRLVNGVFQESQGGSLIHSRATAPDIVERPGPADAVRTFRISTNTLGAGFVESIANETLLALRNAQPFSQRGTAIRVPVLEAGSKPRIGRFGWKTQHASLESFATDAYLNEMGITTPLLNQENTANGKYVGPDSGYDPVPDPEDDGVDVVSFANFMRATKAPARGPETADTRAGAEVFASLGCAVCHTAQITTAPPGTVINAGAFVVPHALGNKVIHPYSDFLLHDVGTGDGIPALADQPSTARQLRTAPLWGLRTRNRLMHDGLSQTPIDAINRHGGQAAAARMAYARLSPTARAQLLAFLDSL